MQVRRPNRFHAEVRSTRHNRGLFYDGKSLTLNLRRNAVFHDGKPITSEDVAFSIMQIKANHPFTTLLGPVE